MNAWTDGWTDGQVENRQAGGEIKINFKKNNTDLCGIPITMLSTPAALTESITCFIAGISTSQPSSPKRFSDDHFFARYCSKLVPRIRRFISVRFSLLVISMIPGISKRFFSQSHCSRLLMNMNSTPMRPQYIFFTQHR